MSSHRVLVLQSVEDRVTEFRRQRMEQSPYLQDYEIEQCYAVELTGEQRELPTPLMMNQVYEQGFDSDSLLARLEQRIHSFSPDCLAVHVGFVFMSFPEEMLSVLRTTKNKFPRVRIALEPGRLNLDIIPDYHTFLDDSEETRELIRHIF